MSTIYRTRVALEGWVGGPGVNTMYWSKGTLTQVGPDEVQNWHTDISDCFNSLKSWTVDNWRYTVEPTAEEIDVATGNIIGVVNATGGAISDVNGTANNSGLSRATQCVVATRTDVWQGGRRLQGRLFFGPMAMNAFSEEGQIGPSATDDITDAFAALNTGTGPRWAVYSRPKPGAEGYYGDIVSVQARSKPGTLRSRRD